MKTDELKKLVIRAYIDKTKSVSQYKGLLKLYVASLDKNDVIVKTKKKTKTKKK